MKHESVSIEILSTGRDTPLQILHVIKKAHNKYVEKEGTVECLNMYRRLVLKAPLNGKSSKGFIFKSFLN
jgi:hypothetical protein